SVHAPAVWAGDLRDLEACEKPTGLGDLLFRTRTKLCGQLVAEVAVGEAARHVPRSMSARNSWDSGRATRFRDLIVRATRRRVADADVVEVSNAGCGGLVKATPSMIGWR